MTIFVDSGISLTALFLLDRGEGGGVILNYLCVRYTSGCCVNCRCRSFVRFSRGRFVRLSHKALLYRAINTQLTVNQKT